MEDISFIIKNSPVAAVIFVITLITSFKAFSDPVLKANFMFNPYRISRNKEYQRFLTHGLIHADHMHLAFNMLTFYFFAFFFERLIGHWQFAVFYLGSLALSSVTSFIKHKDNPGYNALGASGAVSAIVLGVVMFYPDIPLRILFIPIDIPGWIMAIAFIGYSHYASRHRNDNIGHEAHLWGAFSGILLTLLLKPVVIEYLRQFIERTF